MEQRRPEPIRSGPSRRKRQSSSTREGEGRLCESFASVAEFTPFVKHGSHSYEASSYPSPVALQARQPIHSLRGRRRKRRGCNQEKAQESLCLEKPSGSCSRAGRIRKRTARAEGCRAEDGSYRNRAGSHRPGQHGSRGWKRHRSFLPASNQNHALFSEPETGRIATDPFTAAPWAEWRSGNGSRSRLFGRA